MSKSGPFCSSKQYQLCDQNEKLLIHRYNNLIGRMSKTPLPSFFYQGQKVLNAEDGLGSVWISGLHFASDLKQLQDKNITGVVSAVDLGIVFPGSISHYQLNLKDNQQQEIRYTFFPVIRFIEQERKKGNVLVHCAAGVSRSAALLIAYIMNKKHLSYEACLRIVERGRACVNPNAGFVRQLKCFSQDLGISG